MAVNGPHRTPAPQVACCGGNHPNPAIPKRVQPDRCHETDGLSLGMMQSYTLASITCVYQPRHSQQYLNHSRNSISLGIRLDEIPIDEIGHDVPDVHHTWPPVSLSSPLELADPPLELANPVASLGVPGGHEAGCEACEDAAE